MTSKSRPKILYIQPMQDSVSNFSVAQLSFLLKIVNLFLLYIEQADCIPFKDFDDLLALAWSLPQSFDPNKNSSSRWQWDFAGSMFFSFVVVSTVGEYSNTVTDSNTYLCAVNRFAGFGNQAPSTIGDQAAVILYSLLGIPMYLNVVSRMSADGKKLLVELENKLSPKVNNYDFVIIGIFAIFFFAATCLIPAALLTISENWTFHESMSFSFITLSTIGEVVKESKIEKIFEPISR